MISYARRWSQEALLGFYRSVVLVAITIAIPAMVVAVGFFGFRLTLSWTGHAGLPLAEQGLAMAGEVALAAWWTLLTLTLLLAVVGRQLTETARECSRSWLGLQIEPRYRPRPPVTRMATGYWWNGHGYYQSERKARIGAWFRPHYLLDRHHEPQLRRDALWVLVAGVTVAPVAALPVAAVAGGAYVAAGPGPLGWGVALVVVGVGIAPFGWRILGPLAPRLLGPAPRSRVDERIEELETVRAELTQAQAAELERIERGLHDGAQARMVALGMSLGAVEALVDADPEAAKKLLGEARASVVTALVELRSLARGINPPVLAERGLVDAIRALALDAPLEIVVRASVLGRPERPIQAAVYFAVAELLANVAKHARATRATVELGYDSANLTAVVADDGVGGAAGYEGSGLSGIERRIAAFDGRLHIDSPPGGPTRIAIMVPCALS